MGWFSKKTDHWERKPGDVAVRIDSSDVKRNWINKPFTVWDGTVALVFAKGELLGKLVAGKHDIDGPFRKWIAGDQQTTLLIVDDGDLSLDARVSGLYSRENVQLDASLRLTMSLSVPEAFYLNVMKDRRRYVEDDLRSQLQPEFYDALLAFTSTHPIDDLYHNAELRQQIADQLRERVGQSIARLGFSLVALNLVNITSDQFDPRREAMADVHLEGRDAAVEAARLEVLKSIRENLADSEKHKTLTEHDLIDAMRQATHELGLKDRLRADEYQRLEARLAQDALDYYQEREQSREMGQVEHGLEIEATEREHGRTQSDRDVDTFLGQRIRGAEAEAQVDDLERSGRAKDWDLARKIRDDTLDARRKKKMTDVEVERERVKSLSQADTATKIALGLGDAQALLELERMGRQKEMTPDQLLVLAAAESEAVAAALTERFKSEGKLNDEVMEQLRRQMEQERLTNRDHASQLERVMNQALQQMGQVATARSDAYAPGGQTIITPGQSQKPIVINPQQAPPPPPPEPRKKDERDGD
jgi:SPFH domain / Band 7 family